jgi:hypothetical protein
MCLNDVEFGEEKWYIYSSISKDEEVHWENMIINDTILDRLMPIKLLSLLPSYWTTLAQLFPEDLVTMMIYTCMLKQLPEQCENIFRFQ